MRSEIGRTPHACQDSMNRISSERAAAASSGSRSAPAMSPRYGCPPGPALRPSEDSDTAETVAAAAARKSAMSVVSASSMPMLPSGPSSWSPAAVRSNTAIPRST
eukprot:6822987-Alexandrium_andersonii.AAC.1